MAVPETVTVSADDLTELITGCFEHLGISQEDAKAVAEALVYANLRAIDSHGFERVPVYMERVRAGLSRGSDEMAILVDRGAFCCIDARHGLGPAVGARACDLAGERARQHGVGLVSVRNSTNFGAAGFYALKIARAGLIGLVATNAPKMMAPYGAAEPFLGSNPIAIALPFGERDEFVLDMSSTIVARGKIRRASTLGQPLAPGLALDAEGRPTTDPAEALAGILLPFGGPKGSGLALAISLLVGILAGADFDDEVASIYEDGDRPQNLGQLFLAIDPAGVTNAEDWHARVDGLAERLQQLQPLPGFEEVQYPGARSAARARRRAADGIPLSAAEMDQVAVACRENGAVALAERIEALKQSRAPRESEVPR
jgi:LDH2 family malate/lactate/ureidoglycolate dehydrogenase